MKHLSRRFSERKEERGTSTSSAQGFTIIELAIVLVIIGLILGAVMKGQSVLENAKIKRVMGDIEGIAAAVNTYYDRYSAFPGDDVNANNRWSYVQDGDGNGLIEDTGGGDCNSDPHENNECNEAWQALKAALIIKGNANDTRSAALPKHALGGSLYLDNYDFGTGIGTKNYVGGTNISDTIAELMDKKFDDGVDDTGTFQADGDYDNDGTMLNVYYALL